MWHPSLRIGMNGHGVVERRSFLKHLAGVTTAAGVMSLSWHDLLVVQAEQLRSRGKAMILLWMDGGPSQFETFNPKIGSKNQGPAKAISTKIPGVQVGEHWPKTAAVLDRITLIRSMNSGERDHMRAIRLVRTGYPTNPAFQYPTWGSVVMHELVQSQTDLPPFVRISKPRIATRDVNAGILGAKYESFKVAMPGKMPPNLTPTVSNEVLERRLKLAGLFDNEFAADGGQEAVKEKQAIYDRTARFVTSPKRKVFDLSSETEKLRDAYGRSPFGQGCLLARRLIEQGVTFVEVFSSGTLNDQGWDTHKNGFAENPILAQETDAGYATLLTDLADRGMLEDTLVVWMGEFGRTPKFKEKGGRDHYSEGWLAALSGAGVKPGQVIGATDKDGVKVIDRPVDVPDLFVSFCHALGIDPRDEYIIPSTDQPTQLVKGGALVEELFS